MATPSASPCGRLCGSDSAPAVTSDSDPGFSDSLARLERQKREGGPGVADVVRAIGVQGMREPAARFPLVGLQPRHALLKRRVLRGQARLPQDVHDEPRAVTIAG